MPRTWPVIIYGMSAILVLVFLLPMSGSKGGLFWPNDPEEDDRKMCLTQHQDDTHLDVVFILFSKPDTGGQVITSRPGVIRQSTFSARKDTKFIIHRYTDKASASWVYRMVQAFLEHHDVNVIVVNWQKGGDSLNYAQSAANTRRVGEIVGDFIKTLNEVTGAPYSSHHLIGHSLGSHISGFAGARVKGQVGRITGLDPAGPCFRFVGPKERLSEDDALFVDAIHTDGDSFLQGGFGTELRMGDADFYPNGGEKQPGCDSWFWRHSWDLLTKWVKGFEISVACSHGRVRDLFTESINPNNSFKAHPCDKPNNYKICETCGLRGCSRMGYFASRDRHGVYTLRTHKNSPFSF